MPDEPRVQGTLADLLANAERCQRLAANIIDPMTKERLLEMARECEERAEALRKQTCQG
jgi:hypothetical protein